MKSPAFLQALNDARRSVTERTVDRLAHFGTIAASRLGQLIEHADPWVSLTAIRTLFSVTHASKELAELEARLTTLEEGGEQDQPRGWRRTG